jgi:putative transposase
MKRSKFTEVHIIKALKEHENGRKIDKIFRELGISPASFYNWKERFGGMEASVLKRLKDLQWKNSMLQLKNLCEYK